MAAKYRTRTVFRAISPGTDPIVVDLNCWRVQLCFGSAPGVPLIINGTDVGSVMSSGQSPSLLSFGGAMSGTDPVAYRDTWTITSPAVVPFANTYLIVLEYMDPL
jgi:hypothetical protein